MQAGPKAGWADQYQIERNHGSPHHDGTTQCSHTHRLVHPASCLYFTIRENGFLMKATNSKELGQDMHLVFWETHVLQNTVKTDYPRLALRLNVYTPDRFLDSDRFQVVSAAFSQNSVRPSLVGQKVAFNCPPEQGITVLDSGKDVQEIRFFDPSPCDKQ